MIRGRARYLSVTQDPHNGEPWRVDRGETIYSGISRICHLWSGRCDLPILRRRPLFCSRLSGGGPRVVVSTAAFHARVRGSVPGLGGLKETKMFLPHLRVKVSIVGSLRDREVACSASDRQGSNFESCVWRTVSSQSSHHPQEVLLAQFSLYVHKSGLKPDSFHCSRLSCGHCDSFHNLCAPWDEYNLCENS